MTDKDGEKSINIRKCVLNLGKLGVPIDVISDALELHTDIVENWLSKENIDPGNIKKEIKTRQAKGIIAAKARGVRFGRPKIEVPDDFERIVQDWENKKISVKDAMQICGMKQATFYRRVREYRMNNSMPK